VEYDEIFSKKEFIEGRDALIYELQTNPDNTVNVFLIEDKLYTKEEVIEFGLKCVNLGMDLNNNPLPRLNEMSGKEYYYEWLKQNL